MKAAQHREFRDLLVRVLSTAFNQNTAAQGIAAWHVVMGTCEMPRRPEDVTDEFMDRCADWFSERVDESAAADGLRCDIVVYQLMTGAEFALVTPIVIVP